MYRKKKKTVSVSRRSCPFFSSLDSRYRSTESRPNSEGKTAVGPMALRSITSFLGSSSSRKRSSAEVHDVEDSEKTMNWRRKYPVSPVNKGLATLSAGEKYELLFKEVLPSAVLRTRHSYGCNRKLNSQHRLVEQVSMASLQSSS